MILFAAPISTRSVIGLRTPITLHYLLYRMTSPLEPFIYQAF
jgi:hypothetical protein